MQIEVQVLKNKLVEFTESFQNTIKKPKKVYDSCYDKVTDLQLEKVFMKNSQTFPEECHQLFGNFQK